MAHPLFDELREKDFILPNGNCIPDIFNFSEKEKQIMGQDLWDILVPGWYDPMTSPHIHTVQQVVD